jgi:hypothetical protein
MDLELRVDAKPMVKAFRKIRADQLPFAQSLALTMTAGDVGLEWQDVFVKELDRPTPFTVNSVAVIPARKSRLVARVLVKDIAAQYLEPLVDGGPHFLGKKQGLLGPRDVKLNAYGNLSRGKLASLKRKKGVYVGPIKTKGGQVVNGVWERRPAKKGLPAHLKLVIRFADPLPVENRLDLITPTRRVVLGRFPLNFAKAFNHAIATMR